MLEYAKVILPKISSSKDLFRKELRKCVNWVEEPGELDELIKWCTARFGNLYPDILDEVFSTSAA